MALTPSVPDALHISSIISESLKVNIIRFFHVHRFDIVSFLSTELKTTRYCLKKATFLIPTMR